MKHGFLSVFVLAATLAACTTPGPTRPSPPMAGEPGAPLTAISPGVTIDWHCVVQASLPTSGLFASEPDAKCAHLRRYQMGYAEPGSAALVAPGPPTNLTSSTGANTVILQWFAPAGGDPPTSYVIEAGSTPGQNNLANFDTGNNGTQFSTANVPPGTYYVRVRARNAAGVSPPSTEVVINFGQTPCVPPGPPTSLTYTLAGDLLSLSWFPPATGGQPISYIVQAGSASGAVDLFNGNVGLITSITNRRVPPGTYFIRILAVNTCGTSGPSNEVSFTVVPQRPLQFTAPAVLNAVVGQPFSYSFCTPAPTNPNDLCNHDAGCAACNPNGGQPPYHFELDTGVGFPPFGLTLHLNGLLQGTPTVAGVRTFGVRAIDLAGNDARAAQPASVSRQITITVSDAPPPPPTTPIPGWYDGTMSAPAPASGCSAISATWSANFGVSGTTLSVNWFDTYINWYNQTSGTLSGQTATWTKTDGTGWMFTATFSSGAVSGTFTGHRCGSGRYSGTFTGRKR